MLPKDPTRRGAPAWVDLNAPHLFRRLPQQARLSRVKASLGPAGGRRLKERVVGHLPILVGYRLSKAESRNGRVALHLTDQNQRPKELVADLVIAATGYRFDFQKLPFMDQSLKARIAHEEQLPELSSYFESSVPGLFFVGLASANCFGPVMRFIAGTGFTARRIATDIAEDRRTKSSPVRRPAKVRRRLKPTRIKIENQMLPSLDTRYPALILKMSRGVIHHGALSSRANFGQVWRACVCGCRRRLYTTGQNTVSDEGVLWNICPADSESFVKAMLLIGEIIARPTIVIPMDDLSAVMVAENASSLAPWFLVPHVPPQLPRQLANKSSLHTLCAEIGIPDARSIVPSSFDDVKAFADGTQFPVLVKAAQQWRPMKNMVCTTLAETPAQLFSLCENSNYEGTERLMIQEYIPGDDWICHGYYNSEKNVNVTFTGRKWRFIERRGIHRGWPLGRQRSITLRERETPEGGCLLGHYRHGLALGPARRTVQDPGLQPASRPELPDV